MSISLNKQTDMTIKGGLASATVHYIAHVSTYQTWLCFADFVSLIQLFKQLIHLALHLTASINCSLNQLLSLPLSSFIAALFPLQWLRLLHPVSSYSQR